MLLNIRNWHKFLQKTQKNLFLGLQNVSTNVCTSTPYIIIYIGKTGEGMRITASAAARDGHLFCGWVWPAGWPNRGYTRCRKHADKGPVYP